MLVKTNNFDLYFYAYNLCGTRIDTGLLAVVHIYAFI